MSDLDFTEGQYVYHVGHDLIGRGIYVKRQVLLVWNPKGDEYKVGDSKDPRSCNESGFPSRGVSFYSTPVEAVNAYVVRNVEAAKVEIACAEAAIKQAKARIDALRKIDHTKLKLRYEEDNWTPCDF